MKSLGGAETDEVGYDTTWDESDLDAIRYAWRRYYRRPGERIGWVARCCWFVSFLFYTPYEREIVLAVPTTLCTFEPALGVVRLTRSIFGLLLVRALESGFYVGRKAVVTPVHPRNLSNSRFQYHQAICLTSGLVFSAQTCTQISRNVT